MSTIIVADASCLIGLSNIGKLSILPRLYSTVYIPPAVSFEFGFPVPFATIVSPMDLASVALLKLQLGAGESEAITLASEQHCAVILDDKKARGIAEQRGLIVVGTLGVLIKAKLTGELSSLRETLNDLETKGFFISSNVKFEALRIVGE